MYTEISGIRPVCGYCADQMRFFKALKRSGNNDPFLRGENDQLKTGLNGRVFLILVLFYIASAAQGL